MVDTAVLLFAASPNFCQVPIRPLLVAMSGKTRDFCCRTSRNTTPLCAGLLCVCVCMRADGASGSSPGWPGCASLHRNTEQHYGYYQNEATYSLRLDFRLQAPEPSHNGFRVHLLWTVPFGDEDSETLIVPVYPISVGCDHILVPARYRIPRLHGDIEMTLFQGFDSIGQPACS